MGLRGVSSLREMEGLGFGRARVLVAVKWIVSLLVGVAQVIARQCLRFRAFVCLLRLCMCPELGSIDECFYSIAFCRVLVAGSVDFELHYLFWSKGGVRDRLPGSQQVFAVGITQAFGE